MGRGLRREATDQSALGAWPAGERTAQAVSASVRCRETEHQRADRAIDAGSKRSNSDTPFFLQSEDLVLPLFDVTFSLP
jgi:hypothetical protein